MHFKTMFLLRVLVAIAAAWPLTVAGQSQVPAGYFLERHTPLPDSLTETTGGTFRIQIVRVASDSAARRALILAESVFPDAQMIERDAAAVKSAPVQQRLQQAARLPGPRWWWDDFADVLTPYAVTAATVDYYINRIRARSGVPNPFSAGYPHAGLFSYHATVTAAPNDGPAAGGQLVRMTLEWQYMCGRLCAVQFSASREVLISMDGRIVEVRGDRRPVVIAA